MFAYRDMIPYGTEFVCCALLHVVSASCPDNAAAANAAIMTVLVYLSANISNGQLNPLVTTLFTCLGYLNPIQMLMFWASQILGCAAGALVILSLKPKLVFGTIHDDTALGCFIPHDQITNAQIIAFECIASYILLMSIFSVLWCTQNKKAYGNTGPIIVGIASLSVGYLAGPWTGASVNPARTLGSHVVTLCKENNKLPYYIIGEFIGCLISLMTIVCIHGICKDPWYIEYVPRRWRKAVDSIAVMDANVIVNERLSICLSDASVTTV